MAIVAAIILIVAAPVYLFRWMQRNVAFRVPAVHRREDARALFDAPAWVFDLVRRPGGFVLALQSEPGSGDADIVVYDDGATHGRVIARRVYHAQIGFADGNVTWVTCPPANGPDACAAYVAPIDGSGVPRRLAAPAAPDAGPSTTPAPIPKDCSAVRTKTVAGDVILQCSRMRPERGTIGSLHRLKAGAPSFEPLVDDIETFDVDDRSVYFASRSTVFVVPLR